MSNAQSFTRILVIGSLVALAACGTSSHKAGADAGGGAGGHADAAADHAGSDGGAGAAGSTVDASDASDAATTDARVTDARASDASATDAATSDGGTRVTVYDLQADWSDTANPNGVWSYDEGETPLPHVDSWLGGSSHGGGTTTQPAWARDPGASFGAPNTFLPAWFKSSGFQSWTPMPDWSSTGDVLVHTTDGANGLGAGTANVRWTSPVVGTIDITGGVWMGVLAGRANDWTLALNGVRLAGGSLASGDGFTRTHPAAFSSGVDGGAGLSHLHVAVGDVLSLQLVRTSMYGYFVGIVETITATSSEAPAADAAADAASDVTSN